MIVIDRPRPRPTADEVADAPEVLFREARRRRRRRWLLGGIVASVVVATVASIVAVGERVGRPAPERATAARGRPIGSNAGAIGVAPVLPGPLAVARNGELYVADDGRNQILVQLPNGRFTVLAGTGAVGFAGDGGPASQAEIDSPQGMAVSADGTLYFADYGNHRVRAVTPDGRIHTVAGDGQVGWVDDGTPGLEAPLTPNAVAISPSGELYVSDQDEVLRLNGDGTFTRVLGVPVGSPLGTFVDGSAAVRTNADDADGIAFDGKGDLFVAGVADKVLLVVSPSGTVTYPFGTIGELYPRGNGGLVSAPDGSVLAMDELAVLRLNGSGSETIFATPPDGQALLGVRGFSPNGIAVGPDGSVYLDTDYGNGYASRTAIIVLPNDGSPRLVWSAKSGR
jgi:sugar lactone lactonase YvrE